MIQFKNEKITETTITRFLDKVVTINQNKITLNDESSIDLDKKHSIRRWIKQNAELQQMYSRRKFVFW